MDKIPKNVSIFLVMCLVGIASCGTVLGDVRNNPPANPDLCIMHCQFLRAGEIEAIVGDGSGHRVRPGLWALSSLQHQVSIVKNMSSAILGGGMRSKTPELEKIDETSCVLKMKATENDPSDIQAVFSVKEPYYLDYVLHTKDTKNRIPKGLNFRSIGWANYMESPEDLRIHFLSGGEWYSFVPEVHGGPGSSIAPSFIPDSELEVWPKNYDDPSFWWYQRNERKFDEPFFYGRFGDMVLIFVFDTPRWLRFFLSPSGAGASLIPGKTSSAWDFEYIIPEKEYQVGKEYTLRLRLIYKKYEGDEDVLKEVRKTQDELGFEKVGKK